MEPEKKLLQVLKDYAVPDPKIVGKLPKGGMQLDFVGHADITRILIEVDPLWSWEPVAFDQDGLPAYRVENGYAHMAGWLTLHGVRRLGIGSVAHNKQDLMKELCSDFLRNASMRFGICLKLWTKQEWEDLDDHKPATPKQKQTGSAAKSPAKAPVEPAETGPEMLSDAQLSQFQSACAREKISPEIVAANAGVKWGEPIPATKLVALRAAYKELCELRDLAHDRAEEQAEA